MITLLLFFLMPKTFTKLFQISTGSVTFFIFFGFQFSTFTIHLKHVCKVERSGSIDD